MTMKIVNEHKDHAHAPSNFNRAFAIGITLNLAFVLLESVYGWTCAGMGRQSGSTAQA